MVKKMMNVIVVFILVLLVFMNKDYLVAEAEHNVENLNERVVLSDYIKKTPEVALEKVHGIEVKSEEERIDVESKPPSVPEKKEKVYAFAVVAGMDSDDVSGVLFQLGFGKNEKEFSLFLMKEGYAKTIQVGTYQINDQMTFEEVAKLITSK